MYFKLHELIITEAPHINIKCGGFSLRIVKVLWTCNGLNNHIYSTHHFLPPVTQSTRLQNINLNILFNKKIHHRPFTG